MKIIKRCVGFVMAVGISATLLLFGLGYVQYDAAIKERPLQAYIEELQSRSDYVSINEIAQPIIDATIAIEDHRFYTHHGVDGFGILRSLYQMLTTQNIQGGGSTITQQLAKNLYFDFETSFIRKFAELYVVRDLEEDYSKLEIIEIYLNIINYGDSYIGISQAAKGYYQRQPSELTPLQASVLVAIPNAPSIYQLSNQNSATYERARWVREAMMEYFAYQPSDFE